MNTREIQRQQKIALEIKGFADRLATHGQSKLTGDEMYKIYLDSVEWINALESLIDKQHEDLDLDDFELEVVLVAHTILTAIVTADRRLQGIGDHETAEQASARQIATPKADQTEHDTY